MPAIKSGRIGKRRQHAEKRDKKKKYKKRPKSIALQPLLGGPLTRRFSIGCLYLSTVDQVSIRIGTWHVVHERTVQKVVPAARVT